MRKYLVLLAGITLVFSSLLLHTQPQVSDLRISGRGDQMKAQFDLTDSQLIAHKQIRVRGARPADYSARQLKYDNFARDITTVYKRKSVKKGEITIFFPYEPVEDVDILLQVEWLDGSAFYHWRVDIASVRYANSAEGGTQLVVLTPAATGIAPSQDQVAAQERADLTIRNSFEDLQVDTVRGDTWQNLADTVRQAYLRQEAVTTEQVMLALHSKNPYAFTNDAVMRIGISLALPSFYEIRARNGAEARLAVARLLAKRTTSEPRLELASAEFEGFGDFSITEKQDSTLREEAETLQKLDAIDRQLEQVEKLINLKEEKLALIEQTAEEEAQETHEFFEQSRQINDLLLERANLLKSEILANARFWFFVFCGMLAGIVILFYLSRWTGSRRQSPSGRAALMRNLRLSDARNNRTLFNDSRLDSDENQTDEDIALPARESHNESSQSAERVQDNLTNANLDLARAYINMGEGKKARALLDNVASEGSAAEKTKAKELLKTIKD